MRNSVVNFRCRVRPKSACSFDTLMSGWLRPSDTSFHVTSGLVVLKGSWKTRNDPDQFTLDKTVSPVVASVVITATIKPTNLKH